MTVQNACLIFILCFSGITGWLMFREPASISEAGANRPELYKTIEPSEITATYPEPTHTDSAESTMLAKLESITIPVIDFREVTLGEACDFICLRARELDVTAGPTQNGVSFAIQQNITAEDSETDLAVENDTKLISVFAEDITLADALDLICEKAAVRWEITDHGVEIVPLAD